MWGQGRWLLDLGGQCGLTWKVTLKKDLKDMGRSGGSSFQMGEPPVRMPWGSSVSGFEEREEEAGVWMEQKVIRMRWKQGQTVWAWKML